MDGGTWGLSVLVGGEGEQHWLYVLGNGNRRHSNTKTSLYSTYHVFCHESFPCIIWMDIAWWCFFRVPRSGEDRCQAIKGSSKQIVLCPGLLCSCECQSPDFQALLKCLCDCVHIRVAVGACVAICFILQCMWRQQWCYKTNACWEIHYKRGRPGQHLLLSLRMCTVFPLKHCYILQRSLENTEYFRELLFKYKAKYSLIYNDMVQ